MKIKYIILGLMITFFSSCNKEGDSYNLSTVTTFAVLDYEPVVLVEVGGTYTPECTAEENGQDLPVNVDGTVDTSTPSVTNITFSAVNSDGYVGSGVQTVIVHNPNGSGTDVTGSIYDIGRPERTGEISLVAGTANMFFCTDMGGGGVIPVYFEMNGDDMNIVDQPWNYGTITGATGVYDPVTRQFDITFDNGWNYVFAYSSK